METLNKTALELIKELQPNNFSNCLEYYEDCKVVEVPAFNQDDSKLFLLVCDAGHIENAICGHEWWDASNASSEYLSELDNFCYENNLVTSW